MKPAEFLAHFEHVSKVGGSQWRADCPACGDKKQHLYINFAPDGKVLLDCKKGCAFDDIVSATNIPQKNFFPDQPGHKRWELLREHVYTDIDGNILGKKSILRKPDGGKSAVWYRLENGTYVKGLNGMKFPLYHLHKFTKTTGTLVIVEGEKDVETVERFGIAATTSPNGAGARWKTEYNKFLKNRNVVIITDNDEAGEKYGAETASRISGAAAAVKLIKASEIYPDVPHKGDISDIAAGLGDKQAKKLLTEAVARTAEFVQSTAQIKSPKALPAVPASPVAPAAGSPPFETRDMTESPFYEKLIKLSPETYPGTDSGNSALFSRIFGDVCRYNATAKEWYIYRDGFWQSDTGGMQTSRLAKLMHGMLIKYSASVTNEAMQKPFLDNLSKMARLNVRENMIKDARDQCCFKTEDLDKDVFLFNCKNGTYDLRNGYFRRHSPNDLISRMSNVTFDENAECPDFEKFYREILMNDISKMLFLQTVFGYSLTGDTSEECFFILYGATTRNGKGTLMETISCMMGGESGYSAAAQPETFAYRQNRDSRQASGDIARLRGVRFLNVSEPPKGMRLDAALIKTLTGRDTITARHLHEREFQFTPNFKLCINTNYLPQVNDDTLFGSDRVRVVTFERHFGENERDLTLKDRLKSPENISGLFNWCLKGLERWHSKRLFIPDTVKAATAQYRDSSDKQAVFFKECMTADSSANTRAGEVFTVYKQWCKDNNFYAENKSNFFAGLRSKNLLADHATINGATAFNVICGYKISDEYLPQPDVNYNDPAPPF